MAETLKRTFVKSISWRIFAALLTALLFYVMVGNLGAAAAVGVVDGIIKFILYFAHERLWNRIDYGREKDEQ